MKNYACQSYKYMIFWLGWVEWQLAGVEWQLAGLSGNWLRLSGNCIAALHLSRI